MGKKSGSAEQQVTEYKLSLFMGLCLGPIDRLRGIWIGEKDIDLGTMTGVSAREVSRPELFGGPEKEGGVSGIVSFLPGEDDQQMPGYLASRFGQTPDTCVGYRGISSVFFTGGTSAAASGLSGKLQEAQAAAETPDYWWVAPDDDRYARDDEGNVIFHPDNPPPPSSVSATASKNGFHFSDNVPYLKDVWADVTDIYRDWMPEIAPIPARAATVNTGTPQPTLGTKRSIYILVDRDATSRDNETGSPSVTPRELDAAIVERILTAIRSDIATNEAQYDVVLFHCYGTFNSGVTGPEFVARDAAVTDIDSLIGVADNATTGPYSGYKFYGKAHDFFLTTLEDDNVGERRFVYLSDGINAYRTEGSGSGSEGQAAGEASLSDILTAAGGEFNTISGTQVRCEAYSLGNIDTSNLSPFDNTVGDSVPVLLSENDLAIDDLIASLTSEVRPPEGDAPDHNPIHIIMECMRNPVWGMGASLNRFNEASWAAAAQTLYDERLGLSMGWFQQSTIEAFIQEVVDHIEAHIYINPRTGLFEIKLIRDDYDESGLIVFDKTNCVITDFQDSLWTETINQLNVKWTNPENEEEESITVKDPANIAIQGRVVSADRNYYGVRNRELALTLGLRDLRAAALPLKTASIRVPRRYADVTPGSVFKLNFPEYEIDNLVMRAGPVDRGTAKAKDIGISAVEDIFASPDIETEIPDGSDFVDPSAAPTPMEFAEVITLPYYVQAQATQDAPEYPVVYAGILAAHTGDDVTDFAVLSDQTNSLGTSTLASAGFGDLTSRSTTLVALDQESETLMGVDDLSELSPGTGISLGGFVRIGDSDTFEWAHISALAGGVITLRRGVLDTVPKAWPIGTPLWFFTAGSFFVDTIERADTEEPRYRLLTKTTLGTLPLEDSEDLIAELSGRPHLPTRPANVAVEGTRYAEVDARELASLEFTWSNRNRLAEDNQVLAWEDAGVAPEAGQTTAIQFYDLSGNLISEFDGLAGESYTLDSVDYPNVGTAMARVVSKRDGFTSLQGHEIAILFNVGYGYGYGFNYGGGS